MPPGRRQSRSNSKKQTAKQSALLRALTDQSSFTQDLLLQLLQTDQPSCSIYTSGHTNRKDNPNCFCGFIPKPGSTKKKGLWQAKPSIVAALGFDPNELSRSEASEPCGLANLGNTCYVNSALQCLFMIPEFRNALYRVEEPLASAPIVAELRELFVHLQWGPRSYVDPAAFARSLNLETHIQQDGQEFMKLLLSKLESLFKQSQQQEVREVVPALFKGAYRFVTECKVCRQESQSSANLIDFYELPLQVQRYSSVAESLSSFLAAELLDGDNQYFCESCLAKVDASRQTMLHQLPPYLCLALQRFMFNFETMTKQKAMDKFSFPLQLDLSAFMPGNAGDSEHLYELVAVQIHKGNSASHGHYVAHVRDSNQLWWRFDDTEVSKLGSTPASHTGDHGSTNAASTSSNSEKQKDTITSSNAYMLLYKKKGWQYGGEHAGAGGSTMEGEGNNADADIPVGVVGMVATCREAFAKECNHYEETKEEAERQVTARQQFVREVLETAAVTDHKNERCCWISSAWLETWANCEAECEPIDNSPLLCQHNKLDSSKAPLMKCIREGTWLRLQEKYKGGPELTTQDVCTLCLDSKKQGAHDAQLAQQIRDDLDQLDRADKKKDESGDDLEDADAEGFYVSATWLRGWRRSKSLMPPQPPTASLTCPHGRLAPEASSSSARRAVVSPTVWTGLTYLWKQYVDQQANAPVATPKDKAKDGRANGHSAEVVELTSDTSDVEMVPSSSSEPSPQHLSPEMLEFPVMSSVECEECAASLGMAKEEHTRSKMEMADACKELANLAAGVQLTLLPGEHYYLIPSPWLSAWRARVNAPKRTAIGVPASLPPLCPVSEALAALLCPCHSNPHRLAAKLPVLEMSRNSRCCQPRPGSDEMTIISAEDWRNLWEFCLLRTTPTDVSVEEQERQKGCMEAVEAGVRVWFTAPESQDSERDEGMEDGTPPAGTSNKAGRSTGDAAASTSRVASKEAKSVVLLTDPPVCSEWKAAQAAARKSAALNYTQRDIIVQVATQEELASLISQKGERRSKRSRRGRVVLQLDSTCTLQQLRLHIFQHLGIHPANADIYMKGVLAEGEELSLAQLEVFPEDELVVVHAGRTSDDDYASLVGGGTVGKAREVEMGFKNTALAETAATPPEPRPDTTPPQEPLSSVTDAQHPEGTAHPPEQQQEHERAAASPHTCINDTPQERQQPAEASKPGDTCRASRPDPPHRQSPPASPTQLVTVGQKRKATGDADEDGGGVEIVGTVEKRAAGHGDAIGPASSKEMDLVSPAHKQQKVVEAADGVGDLTHVDLVSPMHRDAGHVQEEPKTAAIPGQERHCSPMVVDCSRPSDEHVDEEKVVAQSTANGGCSPVREAQADEEGPCREADVVVTDEDGGPSRTAGPAHMNNDNSSPPHHICGAKDVNGARATGLGCRPVTGNNGGSAGSMHGQTDCEAVGLDVSSEGCAEKAEPSSRGQHGGDRQQDGEMDGEQDVLVVNAGGCDGGARVAEIAEGSGGSEGVETTRAGTGLVDAAVQDVTDTTRHQHAQRGGGKSRAKKGAHPNKQPGTGNITKGPSVSQGAVDEGRRIHDKKLPKVGDDSKPKKGRNGAENKKKGDVGKAGVVPVRRSSRQPAVKQDWSKLYAEEGSDVDLVSDD